MPYAPQNLEHALGRLNWLCIVRALCPVSGGALDLLRQAAASDRSAEYLLGLTLLVGDDLPRDAQAGVAWLVVAAESGHPDAARSIAERPRNGEAIEVDEARIAAALRRQADAGDAESMRALGPMYIGGRGVARDIATGLALLQRAATLGLASAEKDLSQLYLNGAPDVAPDRAAALRWLAASANHGSIEAMVNLGYMSLDEAVATGFCWLMRAALLDQVQAQEKLSMVFAQGAKDRAGTFLGADLVQADLWFRLAARSPFHDNSQIRAMIEPNMTSAQLDQAKQLFGHWQKRTLPEVRAMTIPLPTPAQGSCPPMT